MIQLTEKYQPATIEGFAGLDRPKRILQRFAENPGSSAWMLVGPSGLGKTTMALALAKRLGGQLHHIPSRQCDLAAVEKLAYDCAYIPFEGDWHVVLVDEADRMSKPAQYAFLSLLDATNFPKQTVFIFTSNDVTGLEDRFLSRTRVLEFGAEQIDFGALLASVWSRETSAPLPDLAPIVERAAGNVRTALMELELELMDVPAPKPVVRKRWFHGTVEVSWSEIQERLKRNDFAGIRAVEC